jgi:hypothetical protein
MVGMARNDGRQRYLLSRYLIVRHHYSTIAPSVDNFELTLFAFAGRSGFSMCGGRMDCGDDNGGSAQRSI